MQLRQLCKKQRHGDRENSNPMSPNLGQFRPQKRIGQVHSIIPGDSDPAVGASKVRINVKGGEHPL